MCSIFQFKSCFTFELFITSLCYLVTALFSLRSDMSQLRELLCTAFNSSVFKYFSALETFKHFILVTQFSPFCILLK